MASENTTSPVLPTARLLPTPVKKDLQSSIHRFRRLFTQMAQRQHARSATPSATYTERFLCSLLGMALVFTQRYVMLPRERHEAKVCRSPSLDLDSGSSAVLRLGASPKWVLPRIRRTKSAAPLKVGLTLRIPGCTGRPRPGGEDQRIPI